METSSINELRNIIERLDTVILKDHNKSPFICGFTEAIIDRINKVIEKETE